MVQVTGYTANSTSWVGYSLNTVASQTMRSRQALTSVESMGMSSPWLGQPWKTFMMPQVKYKDMSTFIRRMPQLDHSGSVV